MEKTDSALCASANTKDTWTLTHSCRLAPYYMRERCSPVLLWTVHFQ